MLAQPKPRITITCKAEIEEVEFETLTELATCILALDWDVEVEDETDFGEELVDWGNTFAAVDIHKVPQANLANENNIGLIGYMDEAFPMFDDVPQDKKIFLADYNELVGFTRKGLKILDALLPR